MKRKNGFFNRFLLVVCMFMAGLLVMSCTDFFTTSLFPWAARSPGEVIPPVTSENVDDLIGQFEGEPDSSLEILKKIKESTEGKSEEEKNKLQGSSLGAAVNAVGLGQAVLGIGELKIPETAEDGRALFKKVMGGLSNLEATSDILSGMLPIPSDPAHPEDDPAFMAFANAATADNLALGAVVLLLGEASKYSEEEFDHFIENPSDFSADQNDNLALAQAMAMTCMLEDRADELSDQMKSILDQLKLKTAGE